MIILEFFGKPDIHIPSLVSEITSIGKNSTLFKVLTILTPTCPLSRNDNIDGDIL